MEYGIIGTSIWQQNLPLLEKLTISREDQAEMLVRLKAAAGLDELMYLATCNRVEFIYAVSNGNGKGRPLHRLIDFFFRGQRDIAFFPNDFYHYTGKEAIAHVFRTASSLESLVVGETQITGQLKQAFEWADELNLVGPALSELAREALLVAKKVKRETSIGQGCLSMASLAADCVGAALKGKPEPTVALVGSGAMTGKLAKHLRQTSGLKLLFVNRTVGKVASLAAEHNGEAIALNDFVESPVAVDAIISATSAPGPIFNTMFLAKLETFVRPVVCIDLAVPGDFSHEFVDSQEVELVNIAQLKSRGQGNLRQKFVEASKANEIVRDAVNKYLAGRIEVSLKPIFHDCYRESLAMAKQALDDLFSKRVTGLDENEREAVERLVTKLISHSSFQPVRMLSGHLVDKQSDLDFSQAPMVRREAG